MISSASRFASDQSWFWTERGQEMRKEVQDDIDIVDVQTFEDSDAFLVDFEREAEASGIATKVASRAWLPTPAHVSPASDR